MSHFLPDFYESLSNNNTIANILLKAEYLQREGKMEAKLRHGITQQINALSLYFQDFELNFKSKVGREIFRILKSDCGFQGIEETEAFAKELNRILKKIGALHKITSFQLIEAFNFVLEKEPNLLTPYGHVSSQYISKVVLYWIVNRENNRNYAMGILDTVKAESNPFNINMGRAKGYAHEVYMIVSNILNVAHLGQLVDSSEKYVEILYNAMVKWDLIKARVEGEVHPYYLVWQQFKKLEKTLENEKIRLCKMHIIRMEIGAKYGFPDNEAILDEFGYTFPYEFDEAFSAREMTIEQIIMRYSKGIVNILQKDVIELLQKIEIQKAKFAMEEEIYVQKANKDNWVAVSKEEPIVENPLIYLEDDQ